ncbi:hypothetical protein VNO80_04942 [Phaseolus coccineus]|uniref:Uncharacterized protein n=1 Tax=Phaseolus coccineus TaxID=3886 RepID=A0AAN9NUR2_PHACN
MRTEEKGTTEEKEWRVKQKKDNVKRIECSARSIKSSLGQNILTSTVGPVKPILPITRFEQEESKFDTSLKSLLNKEDMTKRLQFPQRTNCTLGAKREAWCKFHQTRDHDT